MSPDTILVPFFVHKVYICDMAKLLLLETATEICSVGLANQGELVGLCNAEAPNDHARQITLLITRAMQEAGWSYAELEGVAISSGPGSYTSLRVGAATAKGLCYSLGIPLFALDTLKMLAAASIHEPDDAATCYAPMIDARREEVYTAVYDRNLRCLQPAHALVLGPDELALYRAHLLVVSGNGSAKSLAYWPERVVHRAEPSCSAAHLAYWAEQSFTQQEGVDVAYFEPLYLKPPFVTQPKKAV